MCNYVYGDVCVSIVLVLDMFYDLYIYIYICIVIIPELTLCVRICFV